ncbi:dihydrofolate reductase [Geothermobacter ehrlichii]|uniref:Dihydrofolate reductase n=1 Tax=Geothermobacter ehrlichii TaxID=213224 RepID=A0A5D3WJY4_9BACT|nr:dihydrofolate reductase [Geothermobacter ehrlichii]TYO98654.1 dihydrofolate reductase [Geothermobacter ehrlichii]
MTEKTTTAATGPTLVVAMTRAGVIGAAGRLPWSLPEDLRLFRQLTWGGVVIMGRKTFASLPGPLPGRINLVVSMSLPPTAGIDVFPTLDAALLRAAALKRPAFVIGGVRLYAEALPRCERMVISWVEEDVEGDVVFPEVNWEQWRRRESTRHAGFVREVYEKIAGQRRPQ